jgi:hypothetical protein
MPRVLELQQGRQAPTRRRVLLNPSKYGPSEEGGSRLDLWAALANPVALRRAVASDYAAAARGNAAVVGVWMTRSHDDLHLAVVLNDPGVESDLRDLFIDMVCERMDPREGELFIFPEGDAPEWVGRGEKLA